VGKTFAQLKTSLGEWLAIDQDDGEERLPATVRADIINMVMRDYLRRRESRFGEVTDTLATVASQKNYTLPTGWSKPGQLWYTDPANAETVIFLRFYSHKQEFDSLYPDATKEALLPVAYTIWANEILIGKTPEQVITMNRDYFQYLTDLSADGDTNRFTDEAWEYLLFASLVKASEFGVEDDRIGIWEAERSRLEAALDSEDIRAKQTARMSQSKEPG